MINLRVVSSFMGKCFIITDTESGKNIEVMAAQLSAIVNTDKTQGSLPHANWEKDGDRINIWHDEDRKKHEVSFSLSELVDE